MGWRPRAFLLYAGGRDDGRMRAPRWRPRALPAIAFPPGRRSDAFPVMAPAGVPGAGLSRQGMRSLRWRSDARFTRVGGQAASITGLNQALTFTRIGRLCPPNALPISRAAPIDRDVIVAEISTQNRLDLARRERRRLHGLVRRRPSRCIHSWLCYTLVSWSRNWQMT